MLRPDVPLVISCVRTALNIILDVLIISVFRVDKSATITANTQATIRLCCDAAGAASGLLYFLFLAWKRIHGTDDPRPWRTPPSLKALKTLVRAGWYYFTESAIRNALYLWLVSNIISMGADYATAWGVFNTIRWGLVMVPIYSLEATSGTFVGHLWGEWRERAGAFTVRRRWPPSTKSEIFGICPPFVSLMLV